MIRFQTLIARWLPVALAVFSCVASRAEPNASAKMSLVFNLGTEPQTLDPALSTGLPEAEVILNCVEGLVTLDNEGRAVPALAQTWDISPDGLAYTFHLREAKWSNGHPVAARDFAEAWLRVLRPNTASQYAYQLNYIAGAREFNEGKTSDTAKVGIETPGARTLRVRLNHPTPYFLSMLAHTVFTPFNRKSVEVGAREWVQTPASYLCTGPFRLREWRSHDRLVLEKNPHYWDAGRVKLDEITMLMIENESSALAAFESGQLDVMGRPPLSAIDRLKQEGRLHFTAQIGCYYVSFNCKAKPFDDPRVRRAFALAIDRAVITRYIARAGERPAMAFVPYGIKEADGKSEFRDAGGDQFKDAEHGEARRLLGAAGYPGGRGLPKITYLYNTKELHKTIAAELQQRWKKELGIAVELQNTEWKVYLERKTAGDYQIARGGWVGDYPDPMTFLETFTTASENNNSFWSNSEYDALIEQTKPELDPVKRMKTLHEAEGIMMRDMPLAPVYFYTDPYMEKPGVQGIARTPLGYVYLKSAGKS